GILPDLSKKSASELAGLVRDGEVSAGEVAQAHRDRIAKVDDKVHAFLHLDTDGALAAAAAVDEKRKSGQQLGPLAGVPLALKDVLTMEGVPTTCGSKLLAGWQPHYAST